MVEEKVKKQCKKFYVLYLPRGNSCSTSVMGTKLLYFLLTLGILYKSTLSIPLAKVTDDDTETAATSNEEEEEEDAESGNIYFSL